MHKMIRLSIVGRNVMLKHRWETERGLRNYPAFRGPPYGWIGVGSRLNETVMVTTSLTGTQPMVIRDGL